MLSMKFFREEKGDSNKLTSQNDIPLETLYSTMHCLAKADKQTILHELEIYHKVHEGIKQKKVSLLKLKQVFINRLQTIIAVLDDLKKECDGTSCFLDRNIAYIKGSYEQEVRPDQFYHTCCDSRRRLNVIKDELIGLKPVSNNESSAVFTQIRENLLPQFINFISECESYILLTNEDEATIYNRGLQLR